jgi:predicted HTH domain antitoxin
MTVIVTLDLPHDAEGENPEELALRLKRLWALDEVRNGRMTRLRAAKLLGMSIDDFLREAAEHGIDAIDYDLDDFRQELAGAR